MVGPRVALLCLLGGCGLSSTTPTARVFKGLASAEVMSPLAALPATCEPMCRNEDGPSWRQRTCAITCTANVPAALASRTRMDLELAGFDVIDTELLNAQLRTRTIEDDRTTQIDGVRWSDASATEQRAALDAVGARGVLATHVAFTDPSGMSGRQVVTVTLEVRRVADLELAWRARCAVDTGLHRRLDEAVAEGTRCALESAALW